MEKKLSISYDKEADVVYITFGEISKAVCEEIDEGGVLQDTITVPTS
nr:DUF2283 domain-containing protein [candidate division KSB1 bacterium]NIR72985.1 DUF2283 domain-containing protein [candidate division KSB1 bacterium]NIS28271.1 DUF2283 domain-containing protein [candidate division KSB1 bacterium]NIT75143.1 DUF2283 domain-containing protein [candidate division KSB1 bacterium]NIU28950.1 DUF2283 domain-containing protein [candidate division KSB1 bacterium]